MKSIPDIILYNGNIQTQNDDQPMAQAVAISGNQILSLGSDKDVLQLSGKKTHVLDLNKRLVLPGFIDTH
ncbi:MAG: amidohydrolase, partial [Desulfobacula sp.]|nr:amidohydrolase [Desulfobacula sp.]